jgi:hypothetical protein
MLIYSVQLINENKFTTFNVSLLCSNLWNAWWLGYKTYLGKFV